MQTVKNMATITISKKGNVITANSNELHLQIVSAVYGLSELCFDNASEVFASALEHTIRVKSVCDDCFDVVKTTDSLTVTAEQEKLNILIGVTFRDLASYAAA